MHGSSKGKEPSILQDFAIEIVGAVAGVIVIVLVLYGVIPTKEEPVFERAVISGFAVLVLVWLFKLIWRTDKIEDRLQNVTREITNIDKTINGLGGVFKANLNILRSSKDWVKDGGRVIIDEAYSLVSHVEDRGFKVNYEWLALKAYGEMWKSLAQQQKRQGKSRPMIVRATHATKPDPWAALTAMGYKMTIQKQFIDHGGIIVRVFLDDRDEPPENTLKTMEEMKKSGVHSFYLNCNHDNHHGLTSDFLWVDGYLVIWESDPTRTVLLSCEIKAPDNNERNKKEREWKEIGRRVLDSPTYQNTESNIQKILTTFD